MTEKKQHILIVIMFDIVIFSSFVVFTDSASPDTSSSQRDSVCTRNVLKGICKLPDSTHVDTVYYIKMTRYKSSEVEEIITISLDPPKNLSVVWHGSWFTNRAVIDGSLIYPPAEAQLVFYIHPDNMKCEDSGLYKCDISALSESGQILMEEVVFHPDFVACTCNTASQNIGNSISSYYIYTVLCPIFIIYMLKIL